MPIYALAFFINTSPLFTVYFDPKFQYIFYLLFIGLTFVAPIILLSFYKFTGTIDNFSDPNRSSRIMVATVVLVFYFVTYYLFKRFQLTNIFYDLFLGIIISIAIAALISFYYKISMHGLAAGGFLGAHIAISILTGVYQPIVFCILVILCGLIGSARLALNAHNQGQVYSGTLLGIIGVACFIMIRTYF